jgi:hypothetical protein
MLRPSTPRRYSGSFVTAERTVSGRDASDKLSDGDGDDATLMREIMFPLPLPCKIDKARHCWTSISY